MGDDVCKRHQFSVPKPPGPAPKRSISELIPWALFGQWARFPSERAFYRLAQRHRLAAVPTLPDQSHGARHEHASGSLIEQVACFLAALRPPQSEELSQILDATGVPVRSIQRRGGGWLAGTAEKGWCSRLSSSMGF